MPRVPRELGVMCACVRADAQQRGRDLHELLELAEARRTEAEQSLRELEKERAACTAGGVQGRRQGRQGGTEGEERGAAEGWQGDAGIIQGPQSLEEQRQQQELEGGQGVLGNNLPPSPNPSAAAAPAALAGESAPDAAAEDAEDAEMERRLALLAEVQARKAAAAASLARLNELCVGVEQGMSSMLDRLSGAVAAAAAHPELVARTKRSTAKRSSISAAVGRQRKSIAPARRASLTSLLLLAFLPRPFFSQDSFTSNQ